MCLIVNTRKKHRKKSEKRNYLLSPPFTYSNKNIKSPTKKKVSSLQKDQVALKRKLRTVYEDAWSYKKQEAYLKYLNHFKPNIPSSIMIGGYKSVLPYLSGQGEFDGYFSKKKKKATKSSISYTNYDTFIKSKCWQRMRKKVLKRDRNKCVHCKSKATQVHHKEYVFPYGTESLDILESVCKTCHLIIHEIDTKKV